MKKNNEKTRKFIRNYRINGKCRLKGKIPSRIYAIVNSI